ncbi:MAG: hypothetical protein ACOY4P_08495 [Pseudomonadota bacterium]
MRNENPRLKNSSNCRSECPNAATAAQQDIGRTSATIADQRWRTELEQCYRDLRLRRIVQGIAVRRCADADDVLHDAIVRALKYGSGGQKPANRLVACVSSITSTAARSRARAAANGFAGSADADNQPDPVWHRAFLPPDRELARTLRQEIVASILTTVVDGDPVLASLVDGALDGLRGAELANLLGLSQRELATCRRRLKRRVQALCQPYVHAGYLEFTAPISAL